MPGRRPVHLPIWVRWKHKSTYSQYYVYLGEKNVLCTYALCESIGKQKQGKANSRKSKSPNLSQAYSGGDRPSSVSSVHSEGDYHRSTQPQWSWDDRPSSTGELPIPCCHCLGIMAPGKITHLYTVCISFSLLYHSPPQGPMQFPYNPLTIRMLSNTPPTSIASPSLQSQQQQQQPPPAGTPVTQQRPWPSLLSEQYETLSDSDDWGPPPRYNSNNQKRGLS